MLEIHAGRLPTKSNVVIRGGSGAKPNAATRSSGEENDSFPPCPKKTNLCLPALPSLQYLTPINLKSCRRVSLSTNRLAAANSTPV